MLYKLFGKNTELLIDHAWGWEPTTIEAIKAYRPSSNSLSSGQVLHCPYETDKAKLVVREMTDLLVLDLQTGCPVCAGTVKANKLSYYFEINAEAGRAPLHKTGGTNE